MKISVPRERKILENRVGLTPNGAAQLIASGHTVYIERDAGLGSFYSNEEYLEAGCQLLDTLEEVLNSADLLIKVKEPHESEYPFMRPDLTVFTYLHLAGLPGVTKALLRGGTTGIAYELVTTSDGQLPLLEPMSEIAGRLSIYNGASALLRQNGGRGVLLGGTYKSKPAKVVIIGAGMAGRAAAHVASGVMADVVVVDINEQVIAEIDQLFSGKVRPLLSTQEVVEKEIADADLVVGAVLVPGAEAPKVISTDLIKSMPKRSVVVDISIDQGGCVEGIRPTSLAEPTYIEHDVVHYAVPNMPSQTARTSTEALVSVTLPYIKELADKGISEAVKGSKELQSAVNTLDGKVTNKAVAEANGLEFTPL